MNIVFVYHAGDCELALESAKAIAANGINMRHKATICCVNDTPLLGQITQELKKAFPQVDRIIAQDGFDGWPLGPNQMFADASSYCYQYDDPWYFWEPDCVPMVQGWVDKLEEEFLRFPAKIMGSLVEGGVAPSGKNVYKLIIGSAVYPAKILNSCKIASNIYNYNMAYRQANSVPEPWDVRCRWDFLKHGRNTDLIRVYWKSCNYRRSGNKIVFDAESADAEDIQSVICPDKTVDHCAVVVHGCKDGSMHRLVYQPDQAVEPIAPPLVSAPIVHQSKVTLLDPQIGYFQEKNKDAQDFLNKLSKLAVKPKAKKKRKTSKKKTSCKK